MTDDSREREGNTWQFLLYASHLLDKAGIPYSTASAVDGLYADLVVPTATGRPIAIETKVLESAFTKALRDRLVHSADQADVATGADFRWLVQGLKESDGSGRLLATSDLVQVLIRDLQTASETQATLRYVPEVVSEPPTIFAAMPFDPKYDDIYFKAMTRVAKHLGAAIKRVDMYPYNRDSVEEIKTQIRRSKLVIADLSEGHASVLYEVGYADGIGRRVIHITSTPRSSLPFNVRNWPTIKYVRGSIDSLVDDLIDHSRAAFTEIGLTVPARRPPRLARTGADSK